MNLRPRFQLRATTAFAVAALGVTAPFWTVSARTAPSDKAAKASAAMMLQKPSEYWPGRRVLVVLPVTASAAWSASPDLALAVAPLAQAELQTALGATNKFSATTAHRFNPILQRGLIEKRLTETDITPFVAAPSLEGAQSIVNKFSFDQPIMIADVRLEELVSGGTAKSPTVQLRVSGKLYEQGRPEAVKTLEITSRPAGGKTPAARVSAAAKQAFTDLARGFVTRLPIPNLVELMPAPPAPTPRTRRGTRPTTPSAPVMVPTVPMLPGAAPTPGGPAATPTVAAPTVAPPVIAPPNRIPPTPGVSIVPQLPAAEPPLGVAPAETAER